MSTYKILKQAAENFAANNKKEFSEESHFESGYGSKYIMAKAGTIGLKSADARLGNRFAVVIHGKRGTINPVSGYLTPFKLLGWMQSNSI